MIGLLLFAVLAVALYLTWRGPRSARDTLSRWAVPVLAILLGLLYLRSPIDLIPDFVGPIGYLDDLFALIALAWWVRRRLAQMRPHPGAGPRRTSERAEGARPWNPYDVLGVKRGASRTEITRAYREQMKRYHPDRVNDLGEELQEVAHRKTLEIQRAYRELVGG
jgi:uncharacterized membrane protein YkvA (DUF1232 family)